MCYVGMTRAKEVLVLITSGEPSVFLGELAEGAIRKEETSGASAPRARQLSLFDLFPAGEKSSES